MDTREISLSELWDMFRERKRLIVSTSALGGLVAVVIALLLPTIYRAEILLMPVSPESRASGALASIGAEFGGLASLAGLSLETGDEKFEAVATLQSRILTETFVKDEQLLPVLFEDKWYTPLLSWGSDSTPTLWDANKLFTEQIRSVREDKRTGLVTLMIDWKDRALAARWANELVHRTNNLLRQRAIDRSTRHIDYINEQLEKASVVEVRQALYRLLETEYKNIMLAKGTEEYAFKVIDPAVPPKKKYSPHRAVITVVGLLLGLLLGCLASVTLHRI